MAERKIAENTEQLRQVKERLGESEKFAQLGRYCAKAIAESACPLDTVATLIYLTKCQPVDAEKVLEYMAIAEVEVAKVSRALNGIYAFMQENLDSSTEENQHTPWG